MEIIPPKFRRNTIVLAFNRKMNSKDTKFSITRIINFLLSFILANVSPYNEYRTCQDIAIVC